MSDITYKNHKKTFDSYKLIHNIYSFFFEGTVMTAYQSTSVSYQTQNVETSTTDANQNQTQTMTYGPLINAIPLQIGSTNINMVKELQQLLIDNGHKTLVDGDFGPGTQRQLKNFQSSKGISSTGIVDIVTAQKLYEGTMQSSSSSSSSSPPSIQTSLTAAVPLSKGSSNISAVKELQQLLINNGHSTLVDGDFGPGTERRVKEFQQKSGLNASGVVDMLTANELYHISSSSNQGNSGQGNSGQGNSGQGNSGQGNTTQTTLLSSLPLSKGSSNISAVKELQQLLINNGHSTLVDGDFGPGTERRVKEFQTSVSLPNTGYVDLATANRLLGIQSSSSGSSSSNSSGSSSSNSSGSTTGTGESTTTGITVTGTPVLELNSPHTDLVKELQTRLSVHYFWDRTINGVFDGAVERAVRAFQVARFGGWSGKDDGKVGSQTAAALYQANRSNLSTNNGQDSMAPTATPEHLTKANAAVSTAKAQIGKPYVFATTGPDTFDCSGLTHYAWKSVGVSLTPYSKSQVTETIPIPKSQAQPGDLLFNTSSSAIDNPGHAKNNQVSHVSIYSGNDKKVHAPGEGSNVTENGVTWSNITSVGRVKT